MAKTSRPTFTSDEAGKFRAFLEAQFGLKLDDVAHRVAHLTPREMEVFHELNAGEKAVAITEKLGITDRTLAIHRDKVRRKLEITTLAGLGRVYWMFKLGEGLAPEVFEAAKKWRTIGP
jgi:DNA-binding NarL/FixJ family response regulator